MERELKKSQRTGVRLVQGEGAAYQVYVEDECIFSTNVLTAAELIYKEARDERNAKVRQMRERERAHFEMQLMRSESFERRSTSNRKKGGRGGRGGV